MRSLGLLIVFILLLLFWSIGTNYKSILVSVIYFELIIVFSAMLFIVMSNQEVVPSLFAESSGTGLLGMHSELYALSILTIGAIEMGIIISLLMSYYRIKGMLSLTVFNLLC